MSKIARRTLLQGLGGMSLALPYLASWRGDDGWGVRTMPIAHADAARPKRVVIWTNALGVLHKWWTPKNTSADGKSFELNDIMAPFAPYKDKMTVLTGINYANLFHQIGRNGSHDQGGASVLGGCNYKDVHFWGPNSLNQIPTTETFDRAMADRLGAGFKFPHLMVGESNGHNNLYSVNSKGDVKFHMKQPDQLYDLLFKDFEGSQADAAKRRISRQASLNATMEGYKHLASRVSASDKRILEAHIEGLQAMDARLKASGACSPPANRPPAAWDPTNPNNGDLRPGEGPYANLAELLVRSFACQLNNVAVMSISGDMASALDPAVVPNFDSYKAGLTESDRTQAGQHGMSHSHWSYEAGTLMYKDICTWRSKVLAGFLKGLAETDDIDGRKLIDNTCVIFTNELQTGLHDLMRDQEWGYSNPNDPSIPQGARPLGVPMILFGGLGGTLKTGLHLDLSNGNTYGDRLGKYSVNEVFLTVARAMGVTKDSMPTIGDPDTCKNEITEIRA